MDDNVIVSLLEGWIKEMSNEITSIKETGYSLKTEIQNLKTINDNFVEIRKEYSKRHDDYEKRIRSLESIDRNLQEYSKKHDDYEQRIRSLETLDGNLQVSTNSNKEKTDIKIKNIETEINKISNNITWLWRTLFVSILGIVVKLIINII